MSFCRSRGVHKQTSAVRRTGFFFIPLRSSNPNGEIYYVCIHLTVKKNENDLKSLFSPKCLILI